MAARKAVTAAAWVTAEKQYADHSIKVSDIAQSLGLTSIELSTAAKDRGWPLRSATRRAAGSKKTSRTAQTRNAPIALVQRVYATIDGELNKLEKQTGKTSQDRERASRALSQITNSLEKAVEMQRDIKKAMTKASGSHDKEALAHAEDLRRAIAERLERLQRQRALGKRSGGAE
ncbi:MAG: hypothetical protein IKE66_08915 [Hyphomicrobium sp.]|nr:hypothetical protein [Hyphomicrobium sp.]